MFDRAYLDIETSFNGEITVVGICIPPDQIIQLIDDDITEKSLIDTLAPASVIVTYNGNRFDLPVIRRVVGVDLRARFTSHDLMYDCWRKGLYGGLKGVEKELGIVRQTVGLTGRDAPVLWDRYERKGDIDALRLLLRYNREDVINLVLLEQRLGEDPEQYARIWYSGEV